MVLIVKVICAVFLILLAAVLLSFYNNAKDSGDYDEPGFEKIGEDAYILRILQLDEVSLEKVEFKIYDSKENISSIATFNSTDITLLLSAGNLTLIFEDINRNGVLDKRDTFTFYNLTDRCELSLIYSPTGGTIWRCTFTEGYLT